MVKNWIKRHPRISAALGIQYKGQPCEKGLEMLETHASILSEVPVDPLTPEDSDVDEAAMSCIEMEDSDDESDDDIDVMG